MDKCERQACTCGDYVGSKRSPLSNPADTPRPVEDPICGPRAPEAAAGGSPHLLSPASPVLGTRSRGAHSTQRTSSGCDPPGGTSGTDLGGRRGAWAGGGSLTPCGPSCGPSHRPQKRLCEPQLLGQIRSHPCTPRGGAGGPRDSPVRPAARPEHAHSPPLPRPVSRLPSRVSAHLLSRCVQVTVPTGVPVCQPHLLAPGRTPPGLIQSQVLTAFECTGMAR